MLAGFGKVEGALEKREILALLEAREGAGDSRRKLMQAHTRSGAGRATCMFSRRSMRQNWKWPWGGRM